MNNCQAGHTTHDHIEVKTDVGLMTVYDWKKYMGFKGFCTGQDDVSRTLDEVGFWDVPIKNLILQLLADGERKHFIDVGSHVGYFSRLASNMGADVMAFEAESESLEILSKNVGLAEIHQIWFDEKTPRATFYPNFKVDVMKLDIEGAEQHAIRHFWQLIENRQVENIIIEVSPTFNDSYPQLLRDIEKQGYHVYELNGEKFNWDFNFNQTNLWLHL